MQAALKLRAISQKLQFSFRRKAQVRTILHFNLICPYHAKETPKERGRKPKPNKSGHSPLSPTVSPCLEKASTHLFPTLSPPLSPLLQFGLIFCLSTILNIVSYLSPPPRSFAVWRLHIEYLLFVLFSSAVEIAYIVRHILVSRILF